MKRNNELKDDELFERKILIKSFNLIFCEIRQILR